MSGCASYIFRTPNLDSISSNSPAGGCFRTFLGSKTSSRRKRCHCGLRLLSSSQEDKDNHLKAPLKIGLAGLGAVGREVAKRLLAGIPGLSLAGVAARDHEKARRIVPDPHVKLLDAKALAETCDVIVEGLPPSEFRNFALPVIERGKIFVPLSVGKLLENWDLVARAKETGARILVPTGALLGLDAVRAAAEGTIHSVKMVTRKPPEGLAGAAYLVERNISVENLKAPLKIFDGSAREGARGLPA